MLHLVTLSTIANSFFNLHHMNSEYLIHSLDPLESGFPLFLQLEEIACKVVSMLRSFRELRDTTKEKKLPC